MRHMHRVAAVSAAAFGMLLAYAASASAQATFVGTFKNLTNAQTGPSTVISTGAFFNAGASFTNPGDYTSASLAWPGGVQDLPLVDPTDFGIGPSFPSQAAMDAAYPFGTYTISLTAGTQPATSVTLNYNADAYANVIPALTAASFNALQDLHTSPGSLTLGFNSFTANPLATSSFTFFTIFGTPEGCGFLSPSATSCTINPGELAVGTTYDWELDFDNRIESFDPSTGITSFTDFDVRTDGTFTTAVPEPATWAMLLVGFAGFGWMRLGARRFA